MQRDIENYDEIMAEFYINGTPYVTEVKVTIDTSDSSASYGEDKLIALSTSHSLFNSGKQQVGCCVSGEITLKMLYPNFDFPRMAKIVVKVRLKSIIEGEEVISGWIDKGTFYIDTRERTINDVGQSVLTLHGYDAMMKAEADYPSSSSTTSDAVQAINQIATTMGVTIDSRTWAFIDTDHPYSIENPTEYTMREVLGHIASLYGGNFVITEQNKLRLVALNEVPKETNVLVSELNDVLIFGLLSDESTEEVRILV